jgi:P-type conjugative transfer protein TrbJ
MTFRRLRVLFAAAFIVISGLAIAPIPACAQWAVFDSSNFAQNVLQAARALQQINNQIQALQNQATMLQNMARNLTSLNFSQLSTVTSDLQQITNLMNRAETLTFNVQSVQALYLQSYPQHYASGTAIPKIVTDAQARWQTAHDAYQQTMLVQSQIAQTVQSDTSKLADLVTASQDAVGALQASQATNQLLALSIKQQLQIQSLLAAQGRASALTEANGAENQQAAQSAFATFIGNGNAYTPN